ncbi:MAG: helix-turn-helix domain-containing protein [Oscillospiraceae bacterium]
MQQLRKQKGLTQEQLAQQLYVSRTAISKWESQRGFPNIESLKAIAKIFSVSVDELLSGEELIDLAETQAKQKAKSFCSLVFGALDCMVLLLLFLPFFGQKSGDVFISVPLLSLSGVSEIMYAVFFGCIALEFLYGAAQLIFQNCENRLWVKSKDIVSLGLGFFSTAVFTVCRQPYAAVFSLFLLFLKGIITVKRK